jgi:hypothetical protein
MSTSVSVLDLPFTRYQCMNPLTGRLDNLVIRWTGSYELLPYCPIIKRALHKITNDHHLVCYKPLLKC